MSISSIKYKLQQMCWNKEVSATFAALEFLSLCVVLHQVYGHEISLNKKWVPIFVSVFFVEFSEIWLWSTIDNDHTCGVKHTGLAITSWIKVLTVAVCSQPYCCLYWLCNGDVGQYMNLSGMNVIRRMYQIKTSRSGEQKRFLVCQTPLDVKGEFSLKEWFFYFFATVTTLAVGLVLI